MVFGYFGLITHFNLPIAGKTFPVAGKVTSLSGCQGCRPCENNGTEIVHLNFICSASKMSRRKKNINSSRQKRQKQTFTDTDRKNLAAKKRKKNAYRLKHVQFENENISDTQRLVFGVWMFCTVAGSLKSVVERLVRRNSAQNGFVDEQLTGE